MKDRREYCFNCEVETDYKMFGFPVCDACKNRLGLMSQKTFEKHIKNKQDFLFEANQKMTELEREYVRKKIKLLYILEKLKK